MHAKLTNPTDDELNRAFAEKVAGIDITTIRTWKSGMPGVWNSGTNPVPEFIDRSFGAVLPWLEKNQWECRYSKLHQGTEKYLVTVYRSDDSTESAEAETLPRAAVIALLRAHGVGVEFTNQ